jgi:hypothetical protein
MHELPQSVWVPGHRAQAPFLQSWSFAHLPPHAPQLAGSFMVSTHAPEQSVEPPAHVSPQRPLEHT